MAIAEADIFGDQAVLKKYGISQPTLWRWRDRATKDSKLNESVCKNREKLLLTWQDDATRALRVGFNELAERMQSAKTVEDAKILSAIAEALNVAGQLKLGASALLGDGE